QYFLVWVVFQNQPSRVDAVQVRHANIQDDEIRFQLPAYGYGLAPICGLSADLPSCVRSDQRTHTHPENRMVISQQYAKRHRNLLGRENLRLQRHWIIDSELLKVCSKLLTLP